MAGITLISNEPQNIHLNPWEKFVLIKVIPVEDSIRFKDIPSTVLAIESNGQQVFDGEFDLNTLAAITGGNGKVAEFDKHSLVPNGSPNGKSIQVMIKSSNKASLRFEFVFDIRKMDINEIHQRLLGRWDFLGATVSDNILEQDIMFFEDKYITVDANGAEKQIGTYRLEFVVRSNDVVITFDNRQDSIRELKYLSHKKLTFSLSGSKEDCKFLYVRRNF